MLVTIIAIATSRIGNSSATTKTDTSAEGGSTQTPSTDKSCHLQSANRVNYTLTTLSYKPLLLTISHQPILLLRLLLIAQVSKSLKPKKDGLSIRRELPSERATPFHPTSIPVPRGRLQTVLPKGVGTTP